MPGGWKDTGRTGPSEVPQPGSKANARRARGGAKVGFDKSGLLFLAYGVEIFRHRFASRMNLVTTVRPRANGTAPVGPDSLACFGDL